MELRSIVVGSAHFTSIAGSVVLFTTVLGFVEARGGAPAPADNRNVSPADLVARTPKGDLHNPYKDSEAIIVSQGEALFRTYPCSGCHGGTGGGGMAPPLTKGNWIYGGDDDSLFRLVTLGSADLQKNGYTRKGINSVVGPMPPMGTIIKNSDDLWKMLAFVRSHYDGDAAYKYGAPASQQ
jgi:mono/diheme cytochrome c family protein